MAEFHVRTYEELVNMIATMRRGDTFIFDDRIDISSGVNFTLDTTVDLNGNELSISYMQGFTVSQGAHVQVTNGTVRGCAQDVFHAQHLSTYLQLGPALNIECDSSALYAHNGAYVLIQDCNILSSGLLPAITLSGHLSKLHIESGSIISTDQTAIYVRRGADLYITGGLVSTMCEGTTPSNSYSAVYLSGEYSVLQMTGGQIRSINSTVLCVISQSFANLLGGDIISESNEHPTVIIGHNNTHLILDGGSIHNTGGGDGILSCYLKEDESHTIRIISGHVIVDIDSYAIKEEGPGDHKIRISGGTFRGNVSEDYLADGYVFGPVQEDGTRSVIPYSPGPGPEPPTPGPILESVILRKSVFAYVQPKINVYGAEVIGAVSVFDQLYEDDTKTTTFVKIQYKLSGLDRYSIGYVVTQEFEEARR